jgi:tartrate-resistant acid phosphatase type 5
MKGLTVAWLIVIALALGMNPAREDIRTGATPIGHSSDAQYYAYLPNTVKTEATTFAVIGDYGSANNNEAQVAALVKNWSPAFIVTVGDNNYPSGSAATIDAAIGQYYAGYIYPYSGTYTYTATAIANRFFPALGNHDWLSSYAAPYLSYFTLPGNERYYDIVRGPVHLFILDSDANEPDGITANSPQGAWLQTHLADSTACWKLVFLHHAPYSSALHGSTTTSQWPYQVWGADAVLAGHDHSYERIMVNGFPYFVNGTGGSALYPFGASVSGSVVRYNSLHGAMRITATRSTLVFQFINVNGDLIDTYSLNGGCG